MRRKLFLPFYQFTSIYFTFFLHLYRHIFNAFHLLACYMCHMKNIILLKDSNLKMTDGQSNRRPYLALTVINK